MKQKIFQGTAASLCVGLLVALLLFALVFDIKNTESAKRSLEQTASAMALRYTPTEDADAAARAFSNAAKGLRVTIIAADGTVLGDSETDYKTMENHAQREEIKAAQAARVGISVRASATLSQKMIYAAVRTQNGDYVRTAGVYGGFLQSVTMLLPWLFVAAGIALFMALCVAKRFAASVSKPLSQLSDSLKLVKDGGIALDAAAYPYAELQEMAADINEISAEVAEALGRLANEKARIDYILDNMDEGFVLLDDDDTVLLINTAACRAFTCAQAAVRGKNILHATRNIPLLDAIAAVHKGGDHMRVPLSLPENRKGEVNISAVAPDGGVILILSDDTERAAAAKMRQEFFQSASHELKTPITSIQGFAELLAGDMPIDAEKQQEIYLRIAKESARMTTLINDIMMISRLESGDIAFEPELVDIGTVVSEVCADAQGLCAESGIAMHCSVISAVRTACVREIREIAGNLVQNAVKYNKEGGRVDVTLANCDGALTLTVFNTGEPIPPEYRTRVFERFFRIDKGRSKAAGGTGLGLSIVKHVAQRYGASVKLASSAEGNTFTVTFPKTF